MKPVAISAAEKLAKSAGATRLLIVAINDTEDYAFTTYGATRADCAAMKAWAEREAVEIAVGMNNA